MLTALFFRFSQIDGIAATIEHQIFEIITLDNPLFFNPFEGIFKLSLPVMSENKMLKCGMWSLRHNKYECWYVKCFICDQTGHRVTDRQNKDKKRPITLIFDTVAPKT